MSKSRQSHQTARTLVSPFFAWTSAVLTSSGMMLDAMRAAAKSARNVRVAVLPDASAPARKRTAPRKAKVRVNREKGRRSRRRRS